MPPNVPSRIWVLSDILLTGFYPFLLFVIMRIGNYDMMLDKTDSMVFRFLLKIPDRNQFVYHKILRDMD